MVQPYSLTEADPRASKVDYALLTTCGKSIQQQGLNTPPGGFQIIGLPTMRILKYPWCMYCSEDILAWHYGNALLVPT